MEVSGQPHVPAALTPGTLLRGGWVGPRAVLDAVVKEKIPSPRRESNPRTPIVQPVTKECRWILILLEMTIKQKNPIIPSRKPIEISQPFEPFNAKEGFYSRNNSKSDSMRTVTSEIK
jgi:hypothetical protein